MNSKIKKIIEITVKNGGCSFDKNLNILEGLSGYTVSMQKYEYKTEAQNTEAITKNILQKIEILKNSTKNYIIGTWIDNGILYIDINKIEKNYTRAMELAKKENQLAIYNNIKNECIYIKKDFTYILYEYLEAKKDLLYVVELAKKDLLKYLNIRDLEYYKNFIYNDFNNNITRYFIKDNKKYIIIKEAI